MAIEMPKSGIDAAHICGGLAKPAHLPGEQECRCGRILSMKRPFSVR